MLYLGELAAVATSFCWASGSILFAYAGRLIGSYNVNKLRIPLAVLFLSLILWMMYGTLFPTGYDGNVILYLSISGIIGLAVGDTFYFRCLVILGPRQGALMMSLAPVMTALLAYFVIDERLSLMALVGIFVTLAGVTWVTTDRKNGATNSREGSKRLGILMGIGGAAGQAVGFVFAKKGMGDAFDPMSATLIRMLSATVAIWIVALFRQELISTIKAVCSRKALYVLVGATLLGPTIGVWMSMIAVKHAQAGVAATLISTFPVVIIPMTMIIHKERPSIRAVVGAIIAVIGVAMLFIE